MRAAVLMAMFGLLLLAAPAAASEEALRVKIGEEWLEFGGWCADEGLWSQAQESLDEAEFVLGPRPTLDPLRERIAAGGDAPADAAKAEKRYAKERKKRLKGLLKLYARLAAVPHAPERAAEFDGYLVRAYRLSPKSGRKLLEGAVARARAGGELDRAYRLLWSAEQAAPSKSGAKRLLAVELEMTRSGRPARLRTRKGLDYYLLLPSGWNARERWPILVSFGWGGCDYPAAIGEWPQYLGGTRFLFVMPLTISTGRLESSSYRYPSAVTELTGEARVRFDLDGLDDLLGDLQKKYSGEEKAYLHGYAEGATMLWRAVFNLSERVAAAGAGSPLWSGGVLSGEEAPERIDFPIRAYVGGNDPYGRDVNLAWNNADAALKRCGFRRLEREDLPEGEHDGFEREIVGYFRELIEDAGAGGR